MVLVEAGACGERGRLGRRVPAEEEGVEYGVDLWGGIRSMVSGGDV